MKSVGIASDIGARDGGSALGVWDIFYSKKLNVKLEWEDIFFVKSEKAKLEVLEELIKINTLTAKATKKVIEENGKGLFFSGDHSGAVGIWSGVSEAISPKGELGLIWIDAHLDSHTTTSSHSKNLHGMPVAFLMGQDECQMSKILSPRQKINPKNVCFIGARSYQKEEQELLNKLGCKIFYSHEVLELGIEHVLKEAHKIVTQNTAGFGISFDIDAFDPSIAPGTGYVEDGGLIFNEDFATTLKFITRDKKFLGAEISEYFPLHDKNEKTIHLINDILNSII